MGDEVPHIKVSASEKRRERALGFVAVGVLTALIVALWVVKARKHDPRDTQLLAPPAPTASAGALADVSVTSTSALSPARIAEISAALAPGADEACVCMAGVYGTIFVEVVFTADGNVKDARFSPRNTLPVESLFAGSCVLSSFREASIAKGSGELRVDFAVKNAPGKRP